MRHAQDLDAIERQPVLGEDAQDAERRATQAERILVARRHESDPPDADQRVELVGEGNGVADPVAGQLVARVARAIVRLDGARHRLRLAVVARVVHAHHALQLGKLADHAGDEVGFREQRGAFDRRDVLTERPIVDVPIEGIELAADAFVLPLGHQSTATIALVHGEQQAGPIPGGRSAMTQVVRGWLALTERASRFVLPDGERGSVLAEAITAERCEIALGSLPRAVDDAAGFALALHELIRMGEPPEHWMPELVEAVEQLGPRAGWDADVGLDAARRITIAADERRASRDLDRIVARRTAAAAPASPPPGVRSIPWLGWRLARGGALLPAGLPADWLGQSVDVYGVPTEPGSSVSFAIRWHGERPAVLWEQTGDGVDLVAPVAAPDWSSSQMKGEALWPPPMPESDLPGERPVADPVSGVADQSGGAAIEFDDEPGSFS